MSYVNMVSPDIRRLPMQILPFLIHPESFAQAAARQIIIAKPFRSLGQPRTLIFRHTKLSQ
jgi:hypothetical protein